MKILLAEFGKLGFTHHMTKHYIPRHAHKKAIAHYLHTYESSTYPLQEINGMDGSVVNVVERKRPSCGMRVFFFSERERNFDGTFRLITSPLRFERTF